MGYYTQAIGPNSTAMGYYTTANGYGSTAIGYGAHAMVDGAIAIGENTYAAGNGSLAMGGNTYTGSTFATAWGYGNYALEMYSTASGFGTMARGWYATSMGHGTLAKWPSSLVIGNYNDTTGINASLFEIGNGTYAARKTTFTVLDNGNVGIGITNPSYMLHTGFGVTRIEGPATPNTSPSLSMGGYGDIIIDKPNIVGGRFVIKESGNVGIGKPNPLLRLEVSLANSGSSYHPSASVGIESNASHYLNLITNNNSETGILFGNGVSYSDGGITYRAVNAASDPRAMYFRTANTTPMILYNNGNMAIAGALYQNSDAGLKKNISALSNTLVSIQRINGYAYTWKDENRDADQQIGLIAQELQKVYPQLVKQKSDGELSVNYIGLIPVLIECIKELKKEVDELKSKK